MEGEGAALDAGGRVRSGVIGLTPIRLALFSVVFGPTHVIVTSMGASIRAGAVVGAVAYGAA